MKKVIKLEKITYSKKYLERKTADGKTYRDGDNLISSSLNFSKNTYTSEDFVTISDKMENVVLNIVNNFRNTFIDRGRETTVEQLYFATETATVVFGKAKDNKISVIPAPCGFGKSTIKLEMMKELIKMYKSETMKNGVIIVGDRLKDLKELLNDLENCGLGGYAYMLESWNTDICKDKTITEAKPKMCFKCDYFFKCKIGEQQKEQNKYPILLMTNARLRECAESIKRYKEYEGGERTLLLIDERPDILDVLKVDVKLLSEIKTHIDNLDYKEIEDKTKLLTYWNDIIKTIERKMGILRGKYKRFILSNQNNIEEVFHKDFTQLWNKYLKSDYKRELRHIKEVITKGGFYVCESNKEFISTIGRRNLREDYCNDFKTIIFDGSALYDPLYTSLYDEEDSESDLRYLYIPNSRTYENLHIKVFTQHKVSKTKFKDMKYLHSALSNLVLNRMMYEFGYNYVVTYKEHAQKIGKALSWKRDLFKRIVSTNDDSIHYFGNTKGSNDMECCSRMFQLGWETMPDYEYAIQFLSCNKKWDKILKNCIDIEYAEHLSDLMLKRNRQSIEDSYGRTYSTDSKDYSFGTDLLNNFQWLDITSRFYQEIHRIRLRDYNYTDNIEVYLFSQKKVVFDLIQGLLPKCNMEFIQDKQPEFTRAKTMDRKPNEGKEKTNAQIFLEWVDTIEKGKVVKMKEMISKSGLSRDQIREIRKNNKVCKEWFESHKGDKNGQYIV